MERDGASAKMTLRSIYKLSPKDAHDIVCQIRWAEFGGEAVCVKCGCDETYSISTRRTFKCKACYAQFSVTSGTIFAGRKMDYSDLLACAYLFMCGAKGISSLEAERTLGLSQRTCYYTFDKFRESIKREVSEQKLQGIVEVDGATFGGHRRHANLAQDFGGSFKRYTIKKVENRRVIVVAKQRGGRTVPFIVDKESGAIEGICNTVDDGSIIQADGAGAWDSLNTLFDMMRVEHLYAFSANMACTNNAESYFSRMRKCHSGTHHKITASKWGHYAAEMAWKLDHNKRSVWENVCFLLNIALKTIGERTVKMEQPVSVGRPRLVQRRALTNTFQETTP
jgi:transposase-like protein